MIKTRPSDFSDFYSENLKSKIENLIWWRIFTIVFTLAFGAAQGQQPKKLDRVGYLSLEKRVGASGQGEAVKRV